MIVRRRQLVVRSYHLRRTLNQGLRKSKDTPNMLFDVCGSQIVDLQSHLVRLGAKGLCFNGRIEGRNQRRQPVGGNAGRHGEWPPKQLMRENQFERETVFII